MSISQTVTYQVTVTLDNGWGVQTNARYVADALIKEIDVESVTVTHVDTLYKVNASKENKPTVSTRAHQAFGVCWCHKSHSFEETVALNEP